MTRFMRVLTGCLLAMLVLGACGEDEPTIGDAETAIPGDDAGGATAGDGAVDEVIVLSADLTGAAERPDPGDEDGSGTATITITTTTNEICFQLSVSGIAEATAAHIHEGGPDAAGPPVIELTAPTGGSSEGCSAVEAELANSIAERPGEFYVNVHNADFPDGAVRGQLAAT